MDLPRTVDAFIRQHGLLRKGQGLVAAVSGGADSLCLLDVLCTLGFSPLVAHLDHQLRPDSRRDAEYTLEVARRYRLQAVIGREDVRGLVERGQSLEEAARIVRYRFLARVAQEAGARVIATGHTADDQAETIVMHFLRGAGPEGLRGMQPATDLQEWADLESRGRLRLIRPLLSVSRSDTETHCAARGLRPRVDASNQDPAFLRNRIRRQLLPLLEEYNPGIRRVLARTARVMGAHANLVQSLTADAWAQIVRPSGVGALALDADGLLARPLAIQYALIRAAVAHLSPDLRDLGLETTERALEFIRRKRVGERADLIHGLILEMAGREFILAMPEALIELPAYPQLASASPQSLPGRGRVRLATGWQLAVSHRNLRRGTWTDLKRSAIEHTAILDSEAVRAPLILRGPRTGDRLRPLGAPGSVKLSDLLVNLRVPRLARGRWPLVVSGEDILWVAGLRLAHPARLTARTRRALILRLIRPAA